MGKIGGGNREKGKESRETDEETDGEREWGTGAHRFLQSVDLCGDGSLH